MKSHYVEIWLYGGYSALTFGASGAPSTALEKPMERFMRTASRTNIRIRSPRLAASGQ